MIIPAIRTNHIFLVPLIVFSIPPTVLFRQQILIAAILVIIGAGGMLTTNQIAASLASASVLGLIIWGKISSDLYHLPTSDSALLLLEFMLVIFLMEASITTISFDRAYGQLQAKRDDVSSEYRKGLIIWARGQLLSLGKLTAAAFGLSLALLVVGDLLSISVNQIAFSGTLVLVAVASLLIILIYGREPKERRTPTIRFHTPNTS